MLIVITEFIIITPIVSYPKGVGNGTVIAASVELSWLIRRIYDVITRLVNSEDNLVRAQAPLELSLLTFQAVKKQNFSLQFILFEPGSFVVVFSSVGLLNQSLPHA